MLPTFTSKVRTGDPFTFVKFGDGEMACMSGHWNVPEFPFTVNTDGHPYSQALGGKLLDAYGFFCGNAQTYMGEYFSAALRPKTRAFVAQLHVQHGAPASRPRTAHVELLLPTAATIGGEHSRLALRDFYRAVKESTMPKVFVGPERLKEAGELLRVDEFIPVPLLDAFSAFDVLSAACAGFTQGTIVLFSAGMPAKPLIRETMQRALGPVTCLDIGSAFDSLCGFWTRSYQPTPDVSRQFFMEV